MLWGAQPQGPHPKGSEGGLSPRHPECRGEVVSDEPGLGVLESQATLTSKQNEKLALNDLPRASKGGEDGSCLFCSVSCAGDSSRGSAEQQHQGDIHSRTRPRERGAGQRSRWGASRTEYASQNLSTEPCCLNCRPGSKGPARAWDGII